ncbi:MAG: hypothetical protein LBT09_14315 [Planctomycetaceae bacterium]|nr:hypothetical protein [Planctomycetaceae bacterium]
MIRTRKRKINKHKYQDV